MSTHRQTVQCSADWCSIVGLRAGDRYLVVSPFFHTFGYKAGFVAAITAGATTIPLALVEPATVMDLVEREKVTVLPAAPALFQAMLEHPHRDRHDLSSLRLSAVGAARCPSIWSNGCEPSCLESS